MVSHLRGCSSKTILSIDYYINSNDLIYSLIFVYLWISKPNSTESKLQPFIIQPLRLPPTGSAYQTLLFLSVPAHLLQQKPDNDAVVLMGGAGEAKRVERARRRRRRVDN